MLVPRKPVVWVGASRRDIQALPVQVRRLFGVALDEVQIGGKPAKAKPLHGYGGASVLEIVQDFDTDTYRAIYTVRFEEAVYVLHVFQKKSRRGGQTPTPDSDLIRARLRQAEEMHQEYLQQEG